MTPAGQNGQGRFDTACPADKPLPPWEQPGAFRRDCGPHRAILLFWTAEASLVLVIFSWCIGLPLLAAFPLSLATWLSARRDLALMRKGLMDRRGEVRTLQARSMSELALLFCLAAGGFVLLLLLLYSTTGLLLLLVVCICLWGVPLLCWLFWLTVKSVL